MAIERIPEWDLDAATDREIAALVGRCFPTDFGGRSFFLTRHHLRLIDAACLAEVATDPDCRGQGIASRLLRAAIAEAEASPAEFMLLFGVANLYAAAGFRAMTNPMVWIDMLGAHTQEVRRDRFETLMVLPLRDSEWDGTATLDPLGSLF